MNDGLTFGQRLMAKFVTTMTRLTTGYAPQGLSEEWIRTMGVRGFYRLSVRGTRILGRMTEQFGEVEAQFIASLAAAWNGCGFCGYGHAIAGSLLHYKQSGEVHPLHPAEIEHMLDLEDDESIAYVETVLADESRKSLRRRARRLYELKMRKSEAQSAEDELLLAAAWLYTWTVECTITIGLTIKPEEAMPYGHPIGRDKALRARYDAARAKAVGG